MITRRAYKFRLKVNAHQSERLSQFAGCNRLIWNKALALQKKRLDQNVRVLNYAETTAQLIDWKKELPFLKDVHSQPLQQTLKDQDASLKAAFAKTKGFPKFKKKGQRDRFRFPQGIKLDGDRIWLPKLGWFRFYKSKAVEGTIKNVTVSRSADKWFVSIQVEEDVAEPIHPSKTAVGIDMGVAQFATLSDGTAIEPVHSFRRYEYRLGREQRKLSRKVKLSSNWKNQKAKIRRIHFKISCVRNDFLHKATSTISKNHALIVLEDLKVKNMSSSAKGTLDQPGKNVAAKSGLNKSILDQGWYEFKRQLLYKQQWLGGKVILVNPANTSRTCELCNHVDANNRLSQAKFQCVACGHCENADLNAAKNILAAGRAVLACGDIRRIAV